MYINVGVGTLDNKVSFNMSDYDFDYRPIVYYDYVSNTIKNIDQASTSNYGVRKYSVLKEDSTEVQNGAICIYFDHQMDTVSHPEIAGENRLAFSSMGFGLFNNEQDSIISKVIQYTNRVSGQGYSSSESNVEYTEVTPTEDPPAKWESERTYAYYLGHEFGTSDDQKMYGYNQITPANYDWDTLKQYLENNPTYKLYKNTELSKRIIIGDDEHCVSFNVGKFDFGAGNSYYSYPYVMRCARNCPTEAKDSGGIMIPGTDPTDIPYQMWTVIGSPWTSYNESQPITTSTGELTPFYTNGRLSANAPATKAHPVTECTLLQFGQVKYGGKTYTGVWRVTYKSAYYWGYKGNSSSNEWNPGAWNQLSTEEVSYDTEMNTYERVKQASFFGVDLSIVDVPVDIHSGDVPVPPKPVPGSGNYNYPSTDLGTWGTKSFNMLSDPNKSGFHIYSMTKDQFGKFISEISSWQSYTKMATHNLSDWWSKISGLTENPLASIAGAFSTVDATYNSIINSSVDLSSTVVFCRKMPSFVSYYRLPNPGYPLKVGSGIIKGLCPDYFKTERIVFEDKEFNFSAELDRLGFQTATFYDLEPYVQAKLYLPYYGDVDLPISSFIGGSIKIQYGADVITGNGAILIKTYDKDEIECRFGPYQCNISIDVPLAVQDANASGRQMALGKSATSTAIAAATGGTGIAVMGAFSGLDALSQKRSTQTLSTMGSNTAILSPELIILQLTYPATIEDKDNGHNLDNTIGTIGTCSYQTGKVKEFLTEKLTKYVYVNTASINATQSEKDAIERLMREGVY